MANQLHDLTRSTDNVIIVGGGLAGLFCALKLAPRLVTVISAAPLGQGASTAWAQGGIAAAVAEGDSAEAHAADTVAVGAGLVDEGIALGIAREAGARIHELPTVHASCMAAGIDPARQPIPVAPAAHYHMGGIDVDGHGRTSLKGLWAGGEVSSTGAHGANRLASNSLLEAVVYAARIAEDINGSKIAPPGRLMARPIGMRNSARSAPSEAGLRAMMTSHVGVIRDGERLAEAVRKFASIERDAGHIALRNMATSALLVAASAWARRESRGAQYRMDYPAERPELKHRTRTTLTAARQIAASLSDRAGLRAPQPMIA